MKELFQIYKDAVVWLPISEHCIIWKDEVVVFYANTSSRNIFSTLEFLDV